MSAPPPPPPPRFLVIAKEVRGHCIDRVTKRLGVNKQWKLGLHGQIIVNMLTKAVKTMVTVYLIFRWVSGTIFYTTVMPVKHPTLLRHYFSSRIKTDTDQLPCRRKWVFGTRLLSWIIR